MKATPLGRVGYVTRTPCSLLVKKAHAKIGDGVTGIRVLLLAGQFVVRAQMGRHLTVERHALKVWPKVTSNPPKLIDEIRGPKAFSAEAPITPWTMNGAGPRS
jgi:hypothetical protein